MSHGRRSTETIRSRRRCSQRIIHDDYPILENNESDTSSDDKRNDEENSSKKSSFSRNVSRNTLNKNSKLRVSSTVQQSTRHHVFEVSNSSDISMHQHDCFICAKAVTKLEKQLDSTEKRNVLYCSSCLRVYHKKCIEEVKSLTLSELIDKEHSENTSEYRNNELNWCCPRCLGEPLICTKQFYRRGKPTQPSSNYEDYLKRTIGLTGFMKNCGHCGKTSSHQDIAVICDNCQREWHLRCLMLVEIPWGNWFCPDCIAFHVCSACVFSNNKSTIKSNDSTTNHDSSSSTILNGKNRMVAEDIQKNNFEIKCGRTYFYHEGPLITCWTCLLKFHPRCVKNTLVSSDIPSLKNNELKKQDFFWCCGKCQENLGIHRILSQRRDPSQVENTEAKENHASFQLLVKMKTLSYRSLMWLPLERVKAINPISVRKWLTTEEALRLMSTTQTNTSRDGSEDDETYTSNSDFDNEDNFEDTVGADVFNKEDFGDTINQTDSKNDNFYNFSKKKPSYTSLLNDCSLHFVKRPSCVKKEWLIPSRVINKRFSTRGTLEVEYYVKWCSMSYEECTWEPFFLIENSPALKLFLGLTLLKKMIIARPIRIEESPDNPTNPQPLFFTSENHPPPPKGTVIVPGTKYVIETTPVRNQKKIETSNGEIQKNITSLNIEKLKQEFETGGFAPYVERPFFLSGYYLFDYQLEGINWLRYAWSRKRSVILADEMGLGKTVQVVSFLGSLWNDFAIQGPFLVIAPLATLEDVWVRELKHWVPFINVVAYFGNPEARQICVQDELFIHGGNGAKNWLEGDCLRHKFVPEYDRQNLRSRLPKISSGDTFAKFDIIVTSYEIFRKDHWLFRQIDWKVIVVDEGHRLKSFDSEIKRSLEGCDSRMRLLLTGTPLQNSIDELFSLLNVLHPEQFPESRKNDFQDVVTEEATIERLKRELQSHILRRTKRDVMGGRMPSKKERLICVENTPIQREMYRNIILRNHILLTSSDGLANLSNKKNVRAASLRNVVMQMRKCCNHPYLFEENVPVIQTEEDFRNLVEASGKLQLLNRMLKILIKRRHRVLIFSQFMRMLNILEEYLTYCNYGFERLDGSTSASDRQRAIDRFNVQKQKKFVFLLSTRAGGLGINLTSADTVIIYDSDWNPHNDLQAQARAHRLGQTKKVAIYRFMTLASVEERIIETAKNKLVLDQVVAGRISLNDVEAVVRCGATELFEEKSVSKQVYYDDAQLEKLLSRESDEDENNETKDGTPNLSVKESVLGSFKIARFCDTSNENNAAPMNDEKFWVDLLHEKVASADESNDFSSNTNSKTENLGRGMRARREVFHFGHNNSKGSGLIDGFTDDDDIDHHDDDCDDDDDEANSDVEQNKTKSKRDTAGANTSESLKTTNYQSHKRLRKEKKQDSFFNSYVVFLFSWQHNTIKSFKALEGHEAGSLFQKAYPSIISEFWDQLRTRRQMTSSEKYNFNRSIPSIPSTVDPQVEHDNTHSLLDSIFTNESDTRFQTAFNLPWSVDWLEKVVSVQLSDRTILFQPFIVEHSKRYFILCSPIPLKKNSDITTSPQKNETVYATALRELTAEELLRWHAQLFSLLNKTNNTINQGFLMDSIKGSSKILMTTTLSSVHINIHPSYPMYNSIQHSREKSHSPLLRYSPEIKQNEFKLNSYLKKKILFDRDNRLTKKFKITKS